MSDAFAEQERHAAPSQRADVALLVSIGAAREYGRVGDVRGVGRRTAAAPGGTAAVGA